MVVRTKQGQQGRVRGRRTGAQVGSGSTPGTPTGGGPTFSADFTALSSLPAEISLSRASTGTRFNSSGVLVTEAINAARFDYSWNGSAWIPRGLLCEEQRTNLVLQSKTLGTTWVTDAVSISSDAATGPEGATTAEKIIPSAATVAHDLYQPVTTASGSPHTWSIFAKAAGYNYAIISADGASVRYGAVVNLTNGAVVSNPILGSPAGTSTKVTDVSNGWYPIAVTMTTDTVASYFGIGAVSTSGDTINADNNPVFLGDGTSGALFTDAQLEAGSYQTSTIPTTTAAATRNADVLGSNAPLTGYLAAGPSVWEFEDQATGTIARSAYAAGAFNWPTGKWYRSMGVYPTGTDTSGYMTVGGPY
jgi:hypothetical protein